MTSPAEFLAEKKEKNIFFISKMSKILMLCLQLLFLALLL